MDVYGPLRGSLFIYDFVRLMLMAGVFARLGPLQESSGTFPYVVYVVPHALFPLMTYFLWIRPALYKPYIALYIAGKTIAVVSIMGWAFFSLVPLISAGSLGSFMLERPKILIFGITLLLAALDGLSLLGGLALHKAMLKRQEE